MFELPGSNHNQIQEANVHSMPEDMGDLLLGETKIFKVCET